mgnify:CR=1 FL=1
MEINKHIPGTFCWVELGTTNQNGAKTFYGELFGWGIHEIPIGPAGVYTMFQIGGKDVGATYQLMPDQVSQGIPPNWMSYVAVESADETAKAIAEANIAKTIILTGAMIPYKFGSSDGLFNMGCALSFVQTLPHGVYITMNGRYFIWNNVRKNKEEGFFEELSR